MGTLNITITQSFGSQIISKQKRTVTIVPFNRGSRKVLSANESATVTMTGDITLTDGDKPIQFLDPNGTTRTVKLPAAGSGNQGFFIINIGEASENLTVTDSDDNELATVYPGGAGWFLSNESLYYSAGMGTSDIGNQRVIYWRVLTEGSSPSVSDGLAYFTVPLEFNGWNVKRVEVALDTESSSGGTEWDLYNETDSVDILSTPVTTDQDEKTSYTAATPSVVDTSNDDLATGDRLRADCNDDGTGVQGATFIITIEKP